MASRTWPGPTSTIRRWWPPTQIPERCLRGSARQGSGKSAPAGNSALVPADQNTGEVLAWVGSAGYGNDRIAGQFDVVLAPRQPGSSFKPYVYEARPRTQ